MFSFLVHPWMLLALLGAGIPILIEILFRRRRRQVELPTIRFLLRNPEEKRIRRQDRLLLILRCTAPFLLAWAVARPVMTQDLRGHRSARHVVLALDATVSMGQQAGAATAFALARNKALELVRVLPAGARVSVVTLGDRVRTEMERAEDLYAVRERIGALRVSYGAAPMAEALPLLERLGAPPASGREKAEFYIFSDFQKTTWLGRPAGGADPMEELRKLSGLGDVFLVDVGGSRQFNYYLAGLEPKEPLVVAGRAAEFTATVEATGRSPDTNPVARVTFLVDGEKKGLEAFPLASGRHAVTFSYRFPTPGEHLVAAEVEGDTHRLDNLRYFLVSVPDAYRVLVLDEGAGTPGAESRFFRAAAAPTGRPGLDRFSPFETTVVPPAGLAREDLSRYFCVVLMGMQRVPADLAATLTPYVRDGGCAVFFLGGAANVWEYNQAFWQEGKGLLPAALARTEAAAGAPLAFRPSDEPHPLWTALGGAKPFEGFGVSRFARFAPGAMTPGVAAIGFLSDATPALLDGRFGRGRVMTFCLGAAPPDNGLPASPAYPVLVQELLRYLAGAPDRAVNLETDGVFEQDVMGGAEHLVVRKPDNAKVRLTPVAKAGSDLFHVAFDQTDRVGRYDIDAPEGAIRRPHFVVNLKTAEGDLDRLEEADLRQMAGSRAAWIRPGETLEGRVQSRYAANELTPGLIWVLGALLTTETLLAARFGRRRG